MSTRSTYLFSILLLFLVMGPAGSEARTLQASLLPAPPQGTQSDIDFAASYLAQGVTNVVATTQRVSCYAPEVLYATSLAPADGYDGETACNGAATTGEDLGPYATQNVNNPAQLVKDHSESDIRADPTNPKHLIGQSKWFVSAEGYNHLLGFYESFDGGATWPVQGHVPGYEGWTDDTDPVGAFDGFGNFYSLILPYQFAYDNTGGHKFANGTAWVPNPTVPAEAVARAPGAVIQRQSIFVPGPGLGQPNVSSINIASETVDLEGSETLSAQNPKLVSLARSFKCYQGETVGQFIVKVRIRRAAGGKRAKGRAPDEPTNRTISATGVPSLRDAFTTTSRSPSRIGARRPAPSR